MAEHYGFLVKATAPALVLVLGYHLLQRYRTSQVCPLPSPLINEAPPCMSVLIMDLPAL